MTLDRQPQSRAGLLDAKVACISLSVRTPGTATDGCYQKHTGGARSQTDTVNASFLQNPPNELAESPLQAEAGITPPNLVFSSCPPPPPTSCPLGNLAAAHGGLECRTRQPLGVGHPHPSPCCCLPAPGGMWLPTWASKPDPCWRNPTDQPPSPQCTQRPRCLFPWRSPGPDPAPRYRQLPRADSQSTGCLGARAPLGALRTLTCPTSPAPRPLEAGAVEQVPSRGQRAVFQGHERSRTRTHQLPPGTPFHEAADHAGINFNTGLTWEGAGRVPFLLQVAGRCHRDCLMPG